MKKKRDSIHIFHDLGPEFQDIAVNRNFQNPTVDESGNPIFLEHSYFDGHGNSMVTGEKYDEEGYDCNGCDAEGYNRGGFNLAGERRNRVK